MTGDASVAMVSGVAKDAKVDSDGAVPTWSGKQVFKRVLSKENSKEGRRQYFKVRASSNRGHNCQVENGA